MKNIFLLIFILVSQSAFASSDAIMTFLLLGQSNMAGRGNVAELDNRMKTMPANVTFFLNGSKAKIAKQAKFGPEVAFARELSKKYPHQRINLVKFAPGGSMMRDWQKGRPHYQTMTKLLNRVRKNNRLDISGVLWMHGERDTKTMSTAQGYKGYLEKFIRTIREDMKNANLPIVIAQISVPEAYRPAEIKIIKKAQLQTAHEVFAVKVFSTEQLSKSSDNVHYDTAGQIGLGRLFARYF